MNTFGARSSLKSGGVDHTIYRLASLEMAGISIAHLPYSMRIMLENLLRTEDGKTVTADDIRAVANWDPAAEPSTEIAFTPARVLMQDFTGVPAVVDLAAMRDAVARFGGDPSIINPLQPAELVIDHSVQVDNFGTANALEQNSILEFSRNRERYAFLRWGQGAFTNFKAVPPEMGIVHQINLEYLARVVFTRKDGSENIAYPDTLVGTDSHTTMINGLGVLGWGVGGIEAEAAMLGQPVSMLLPQVVGFKLTGKLREGSTATDLVLTVTQMLRKLGVVNKFVEFYGPGLAELPLADRATIANMSPEYGATCGIFPVDAETLRYLRLTGRSDQQVALVEAYCKEQGMLHDASTPEAKYSASIALDLATVEPSVAGPRRPQDRVALTNVAKNFQEALPSLIPPPSKTEANAPNAVKRQIKSWESEGGNVTVNGGNGHTMPSDIGDYVSHGSVVIAAITSCTNTSNPSVMVAAGLLAKKAAAKGLQVAPWVKTSLSPGSRVVTEYYKKSGLMAEMEKLRFHTTGYGCMTCIGNSGPLPAEIAKAVDDHKLVVASVLSGNRNFEGRINPDVRANYLMSPPLVVAYALAGRIEIDFDKDPLGKDRSGNPVYLRDIWPSQKEVSDTVAGCIDAEMFRKNYATIFDGDETWQKLPTPQGKTYAWDPNSTYIKRAPYFDGMTIEPAPMKDVAGARCLAVLGDSVTTDHISPAGSIKKNSPAGEYLIQNGVKQADFNSYGSRRGNHEVMVRGTFANTRLRNLMVPGSEGGVTRFVDGKTSPADAEVISIFHASMKYQHEGTPLIVLAGKEYGTGSSRDWAAKGPYLLGINAVIAESFERIHRSNLVGMGIVPLQFANGETAASLGLTGDEKFTIHGVAALVEKKLAGDRNVKVVAEKADGSKKEFAVRVRIDTPQEALYCKHGGILQYVLRQLLAGKN